MNKVKNCKAPAAPAHVSKAINDLVAVRKRVADLNKIAKKRMAVILVHGETCRNDRYAAYISHSVGRYSRVYRKARDSVCIKEIIP